MEAVKGRSVFLLNILKYQKQQNKKKQTKKSQTTNQANKNMQYYFWDLVAAVYPPDYQW